MVEVVLTTNDGREVVRIPMPPFVSWPEGIIWGQRTFFRKTPRETFPPVYEEGLLWVDPSTLIVQKPVSEAESDA